MSNKNIATAVQIIDTIHDCIDSGLNKGQMQEKIVSILNQQSPSPSIEELNQEFKELNVYLNYLYRQMVNGEKDAGNLWVQFTDKFNAYQKKVVAKSLSVEELAQKLRATNPYEEYYEYPFTAWNECVDKLIELSKELK